jgi:hypothetical protein
MESTVGRWQLNTELIFPINLPLFKPCTTAISPQLVIDSTTEAFLAAYKRFTARRGHCVQMCSDNGTNFVGAANK